MTVDRRGSGWAAESPDVSADIFPKVLQDTEICPAVNFICDFLGYIQCSCSRIKLFEHFTSEVLFSAPIYRDNSDQTYISSICFFHNKQFIDPWPCSRQDSYLQNYEYTFFTFVCGRENGYISISEKKGSGGLFSLTNTDICAYFKV